MKSLIGSFIGLVLSVSVGAEPLLEGQIILSSGQPAPGVEVMLFDLSDLQRGAIARTTTDATGSFAVVVSRARGRALPDGFAPRTKLSQSVQSLDDHSLSPVGVVPCEAGGVQPAGAAAWRHWWMRNGWQGAHTALWDATNTAGQAVSAGVYIYRLTVGAKHQTGRMVLIDGQAGVPRGEDATAGAAGRGCPRSGLRLGRFGPRYHPLYSPSLPGRGRHGPGGFGGRSCW